jgi:hypothetical protein
VEFEIECMLEEVQVRKASISALDYYLYRIRFLKGLDRLSTFENAFESLIHRSDMNLDISSWFKQFLSMDILEFASIEARKGAVGTLELLFTRDGKLVLPYRLALLNLIPLTVDPSTYFYLLPTCNALGQTSPWKEVPWRRKDWAEAPNLLEVVALLEDSETLESGKDLDENPYPESIDVVQAWLRNRIHQFENLGGQIGFAIELATFAEGAGFDGYLPLISQLHILNHVVDKNDGDVRFYTLDILNSLESMNILSLLFKNANVDDLPHLLGELVYPFIISLPDTKNCLKKLFSLLLECIHRDPLIFPILLRLCHRNTRLHSIIPVEMLIDNLAYDESTPIGGDLWASVLHEYHVEHAKYETSAPAGDGWGAGFDENFDLEMEVASLPTSSDPSIKSILDGMAGSIQFSLFLNKLGFQYSLKQVKELANEKKAVSRLLRQSNLTSVSTDESLRDCGNSLVDFAFQGLLGATEEDIWLEMLSFSLANTSLGFF